MIYHMCAIRVMVSKELIVVSEYLHPFYNISTLLEAMKKAHCI